MTAPETGTREPHATVVESPWARTLHTTATLAAELGTSERTIRRAIEAGELRATRRAGRWVMTVEDVCEWARTGLEPIRRPGRRSDFPRARSRGQRADGLAGAFAAHEADAG